MRGIFHSKARLAAGTVMAAVSALVISSCAPQRADAPTMPKPAAQKKVLAARAFKAKMPALSSAWEGGNCGFKDNSVSYHSYASGTETSLRLDVKAENTLRLLCSEGFTVILSEKMAYVAIGGTDILGGKEWLGRLGDEFTWANSYEVDFPEGLAAADAARSASIVGMELRVFSGGKAWHIDLSDPFKGWKDY